MRKGVFLFLAVAWTVLLAACGGAESYDEPPEIIYGQDVCSNCNMIISEENYASAYWTAEGEARRFDDMGEMMAYIQSNPEDRASTWVHDVNTAAWLRAEDAWIVMNAGLMTPMGTGIVAVANEEDARALAFDQDGAMVLTFAELMDKLEAGELMLGMGH
jgi:copper chaperone NosL